MGSKHSKGTSHPVPFVDLQDATNNFDDNFLIGEDSFGMVYRGVLCDGTKVALKRCNPKSPQGIAEFGTEIQMLTQFRHPYLVSLIGYCDENDEMILIYEYMESGNIKRHLYGSDLPTLSWEQRLEICIGATRGLHYLHTNGIIHRNVKSTNILLDENFVPKVADFGVSKIGTELDQTRTYISTVVKGPLPFGYLDPEYYTTLRLTEKSDVYSFGVVLFEVLCARPAIDSFSSRGIISLAEWAMNWQKKGQLERIIDPNLIGKIRPESLRKFGETAEECLAVFSEDRPSMGDVLWKLEHALLLQESFVQDDTEENNTIPIGDQINDFSNIGEQSPQISDFSNIGEQSPQISDFSGDLSSDDFLSPR